MRKHGFGVVALVFVIAACRNERRDAVVDAGVLVGVHQLDAGLVDAALDAAADEDEVRPVYPVEGVTPDPLAARLCGALHDLPEKRRAACCNESSGLVPTGECVRMLSAALAGKAVAIDATAVDACAAAMDHAYVGCDWVGPFPPEVPAACLGIVKGLLPARARCRSSLECAGELRCHGVGPTTVGRCGPARDDGAACSGSADALATFVRQTDVDARHPECKAYCSRFKCAAFTAEGEACAQSRECGPGRQCVGAAKNPPIGQKTGKCVARAPGKAGEACPGDVCEPGLQCVAGRCTARKAAGASCKTDFECLGGCTKGVCGRKCGVR